MFFVWPFEKYLWEIVSHNPYLFTVECINISPDHCFICVHFLLPNISKYWRYIRAPTQFLSIFDLKKFYAGVYPHLS